MFPTHILLLATGHHEILSAMEIIGLSCLLIECICDTLGETVIKMLAVKVWSSNSGFKYGTAIIRICVCYSLLNSTLTCSLLLECQSSSLTEHL